MDTLLAEHGEAAGRYRGRERMFEALTKAILERELNAELGIGLRHEKSLQENHVLEGLDR